LRVARILSLTPEALAANVRFTLRLG